MTAWKTPSSACAAGSSALPNCAAVFSACAASVRCWFATLSDVLAKSPCALDVSCMMNPYLAVTF
jgi:hypothetical protein